MVFDPSKAIKKMLGPGVNVPRFRQGRNARDTDGDGISDIMDCQPKNMFRQDSKSFYLIYFKNSKGSTINYSGSIQEAWNKTGYDDDRVAKIEKISEKEARERLWRVNRIPKEKIDGVIKRLKK